ncbi:hypothetical protein WME91_34520 [Sorangium sp. So ce269]
MQVHRCGTVWLVGCWVLLAASCSDRRDIEDPALHGAGNDGGAAGGGEAWSGHGGAGGAAGESGGPFRLDAIIAAPSQHEVEIHLSEDIAAPPLDAAAYRITSPRGSLRVEQVAYDAERATLVLTTARQKLGVTYELTVRSPGSRLDGVTGSFLSADTATFWATDFGDPAFADYQIVAERGGVGEHVVVYVEQGMPVSDVEDTIRMFDDRIYPVETRLFAEAPDVDQNGKVVLLGLDGAEYYGGYFHPLDTFPDDDTMRVVGLHSNEADMLYINVAQGASLHAVDVVTHEFQHMLYHGQHGGEDDYWLYHDEGLAECAIRAVWGEHPYVLDHVRSDPTGRLAMGESLVHWEFGNYDQYALAYLFLSYVASRLGGVERYADLFALRGHPEEVDAFLMDQLGEGFARTQLSWLVATWLRAPSGPGGYGDVISFPDAFRPPVAPAGTTSLDLPPFAGAFFPLEVAGVDYPGSQGEHVLYAGISGRGGADLEAPFDVEGGALVVLNSRLDALDPSPEASGPDLPSLGARDVGSALRARPERPRDRAWLHPPPVGPRNAAALRAWRERTAGGAGP